MGSALLRADQELLRWNRRLRSVPLLAYGIGGALIAGAIGLRLLVGSALQGVPFITIFPAVIIATFLGGLGPGLLALVLGGAGAWFFLLPDEDQSALAGDHRIAPLLAYLVAAGFGCLLVDWLIRSAEQKAALASRNELLMSELHHRIRNHVQSVYSLLNLQAARAEPGARDALLDAARRVGAMASLYRHGYVPGEQVDGAQHLRYLCQSIERSFASKQCKLVVSVTSGPFTWSIDRVMAVSLIASELITNAFRHGLGQRPGTITVALRRVNGACELCVTDTGDRLPRDFDLATQAGLGLSIVDQLATEIGGSVRRIAQGQAGFVVTFPA